MTIMADLHATYTTQAEMSSFFTNKLGIISVLSYAGNDDIYDGVTDAYTAITEAISDLPDDGGIIFFPSTENGGTYYIGTNITFPAKCTLWIAKGAMLKPNTGVTVTINGTMNAGMYQVFTGSGTVSGSPKLENCYPEWFGAAGDGTTNDADAIEKAIAFISTTGGIIKFSNANYLVDTAEIDIPGNVSFIGNGESSQITYKDSIFFITGSNVYVKNLYGYYDTNTDPNYVCAFFDAIGDPSQIENINIYDCVLDGNSVVYRALHVENAKHVRIRNCTIKNTFSEPIRVEQNCENVYIGKGCEFENAGRSSIRIHNNNRNVVIENCNFYKWMMINDGPGLDGCVDLYGPWNYNVTVDKCNFDTGTTAGGKYHVGVSIKGTDTVHVTNCIFKMRSALQSCAISTAAREDPDNPGTFATSDKIIIADNWAYFENAFAYKFLQILDYMKKLTVHHNQVKTYYPDNTTNVFNFMEVQGTTEPALNVFETIKVTDNIYDSKDQPGRLLYLLGGATVTNLTFDNNSLDSTENINSWGAIRFASNTAITNLFFNNNQILISVGYNGLKLETSKVTNAVISNNRFTATTVALNLTVGHSFKVSNNYEDLV